MLLHLRHKIKEGPVNSGEVVSERVAFKIWAAAMKSPWRYGVTARLLRLVQKAFGAVGPNGQRTLPVGKWTATRDLPSLAATTFRELWPGISRNE